VLNLNIGLESIVGCAIIVTALATAAEGIESNKFILPAAEADGVSTAEEMVEMGVRDLEGQRSTLLVSGGTTCWRVATREEQMDVIISL
jgi:hypothetical protein